MPGVSYRLDASNAPKLHRSIERGHMSMDMGMWLYQDIDAAHDTSSSRAAEVHCLRTMHTHAYKNPSQVCACSTHIRVECRLA